MKGELKVYYEIPKLSIYLDKLGKNVNEEKFYEFIDAMLKQALALHMNEEADTISGTLMEFFRDHSADIFDNLPSDALHIYFDNDKNTLSAYCEKVKKNTNRFLQRSAEEDSASRQDIVKLHHKNIANIVLQHKNKEKIRALFDEIYINLYSRMQNNDTHRKTPTVSTKIIFLDFDGVLNNSEYTARLYEAGEKTSDQYGEVFDMSAVERLNRIIDATNAQIVVTSSWRYLGLQQLHNLWHKYGLHGSIIDITSLHAVDELIIEKGLDWLENGYEGNDMSSPRSMEIEHWIQNHKGSFANYVILDDLPMPSTLQPHFVQVNPKYGLLDPQVEHAINILGGSKKAMKRDFYYSEQKKQIECLKNHRSSIFSDAKTLNKGYILCQQDSIKNLYSGIREDAIKYFERYNISWWQCENKPDVPSGHLVSSQIHCLNHLFALRKDKYAVKQIVENATNMHFDEIITSIIDTKENDSYISFEFAYNNDKLLGESDKGWGRGTLCTSIDALIRARKDNKIWLISIEWKYTETYQGDDKTNKKRLERYASLIESSEQLKTPKDGIAHSIYFIEPHYELMRQTLLCEQLVRNGIADNFIHLIIIPAKHDELRTAVENEFIPMLNDTTKFKIVDTIDFLSPIKQNEKYEQLIKYLETRYWS